MNRRRLAPGARTLRSRTEDDIPLVEQLRADLFADPQLNQILTRRAHRRYADADLEDASFLDNCLGALCLEFMRTASVDRLRVLEREIRELDQALAARAIGLQH